MLEAISSRRQQCLRSLYLKDKWGILPVVWKDWSRWWARAARGPAFVISCTSWLMRVGPAAAVGWTRAELTPPVIWGCHPLWAVMGSGVACLCAGVKAVAVLARSVPQCGKMHASTGVVAVPGMLACERKGASALHLLSIVQHWDKVLEGEHSEAMVQLLSAGSTVAW